MARTREAYVNAGQGADWSKAGRWGINRLWFEHDDPKTAAVPANTGKVGIKMNGNGPGAADALHEALTAAGFGPSTSPYSCGAMLDDEVHDPEGVLEFLLRWRSLRKTRYTIWTLEPWQEGWFDDVPALIPTINQDNNLLVAVQQYMTYNGDDLYPAAPEALDRLVSMGVERRRLTRFLAVKGGVQPPFGWEGLWWTFDNLASSPPAPV